MAMHGKHGKVLIGANEGTDLIAWRIDRLAGQRFDNTPLQNTWRTRISGTQDAAGRVTFNWDTTDSNVQGALLTAALGGSRVTLKLYINDTNYFTIPAYIALGAEANRDGAVTRDFSFESSGTVTFT